MGFLKAFGSASKQAFGSSGKRELYTLHIRSCPRCANGFLERSRHSGQGDGGPPAAAEGSVASPAAAAPPAIASLGGLDRCSQVERHGSHHSTSRALGSPCRVLRHPPAGAELDAAHSDGPNHCDDGTC